MVNTQNKKITKVSSMNMQRLVSFSLLRVSSSVCYDVHVSFLSLVKAIIKYDTLCNCVKSCLITIISHILTRHIDCSLVSFSKLVRAIITDSVPGVVDAHFHKTRNRIHSCAIILAWGANRGTHNSSTSVIASWRKRTNVMSRNKFLN